MPWTRDDMAARGLERFVIRLVVETGPIVGEDDASGQVSDPQAQDPSAGNDLGAETAKPGNRAWGQTGLDQARAQERLDRRPRDELGLRAPLGEAAIVRRAAEGGGENHA